MLLTIWCVKLGHSLKCQFWLCCCVVLNRLFFPYLQMKTIFSVSAWEISIFCGDYTTTQQNEKPLFTSLMLPKHLERDHLSFLMFQDRTDKYIIFLLYYQNQTNQKLTHLISKTMAHFMGNLWDNRIKILPVNIILHSVRSSVFCLLFFKNACQHTKIRFAQVLASK